MNTYLTSLPTNGLTVRQRSVRRRSSRLSFEDAVRLAADVFFQFKYRATHAKALWSEAEQVWLGSETFLHWALWDVDIDIPWVVATAAKAPAGAHEIREAVRAELRVYWAERTGCLPRADQPRWLPLP